MTHVDPRLLAAIFACLTLFALAFALAGRIAAGAINSELGGWPDEAAHPDVVAFGDALGDAAHAHSSDDGEA